jgi:hypothetical protein
MPLLSRPHIIRLLPRPREIGGQEVMDASEREPIGSTQVERRAATPIAGAIAGMLFAIVFGTGVSLMRGAMGGLSHDSGAWLETGARSLKIALGLVPFAGIFFLWFIAVARERLGRFEDQFFATVFLGSGLLFLAMIFAAAASAGALVAAYAKDPSGFATSASYLYGRQVVTQIFNVYALRMAAIFLISQATLWLRTGVMPRWIAMLTYAVALILLVVVTEASWVILIFPAWVFMVSAYILATHLAGGRPGKA